MVKRAVVFVAGIAAGIVFVIACSHMGAGVDANASPTDCGTWQVSYQDLSSPGSGTDTLPAGWEPFAAAGSGSSYFRGWARRCAP